MGSEFRVQVLGFRFQGLGVWDQGELRVEDLQG